MLPLLFGLAMQQAMPVEMQGLKGECVQVSVLGRDYTAQCQGDVIQTRLSNGRTMITFLAGNAFMLSFGGETAPGAAFADAEAAQPITRVQTTVPSTGEHHMYDVVGQCVPLASRSGQRWECSAQDLKAPDGTAEMTAVFQSDGQPATVTPFPAP